MTVRVPYNFGRLMKLEAERASSFHTVEQRAARLFGHSPEHVQKSLRDYAANSAYAATLHRAGEVPAHADDSAYGSEMVGAAGHDFARYVLQHASCLGQLGYVPAPLGTHGGSFTTGATASVVTPGQAIPVYSNGAANIDLERLFAAVIQVASHELLTTPGTERALTLQAAQAVALELETALFNPSRATSVAYAGLSVAVHDSTVYGLLAGIADAFAAATAAQAATSVLLLNDRTRLILSMLRDPLSGAAFLDADGKAGLLRTLGTPGLPSSVGLRIDAAQLALNVEAAAVSASNSASIELRTLTTSSALTPAPVSMVSLFTTDSRALRIVQPFGASMLRSGAVVALTGIEPNADHLIS